MKLEEFQIHISNPCEVVTTGQQLNGMVIINLTKPMKMKGVNIHVEGKAKTFWEIYGGKNTTKYRAYETYLNQVVSLVQAETGDQLKHPAGNHMYPFSLNIPANAPSSFEGRRGYVRYICKATIERPWKLDQHVRRAFTVIHDLDLNLLSSYGVPIVLSKEENIQNWCCTAGTLGVTLSLQKTGFVPGEPILYDITVDNKSDNNINKVQLELRQVVQYTGFCNHIFSSGSPKYHMKEEKFSLLNESLRVPKNETGRINRGSILPSLPPSYLEGCGIISTSYFVLLAVRCGRSLVKMEKEILVGTIPFFRQPQSPRYLLSPPSLESTLPPPYDAAPPSYEECVFGRTVICEEGETNTVGENDWAPAYPNYNWQIQNVEISTAVLQPPAYTEN
ncbi:hypothetical protein CHS0354_021902 [Potamilus streckersoni]|uniref:Arrestin C-terminal-like domain-containing protein n=1 Tax=Potamilus streckersoni TaxID=2493646 RepID=A0AAE0TJQ6_9BIVA|nr:hypothetical protein CHS0354_021902 [Potamilus streckersoni]